MLDLRGVSLRYGGRCVVADINLHVGAASRLALLGASASGKSSILRVIVQARNTGRSPHNQTSLTYQGSIQLAESAAIGYVPQEPSLAPWLDVEGNVQLGVRLRGAAVDDKTADWRARLLDGLKLTPYRRYLPTQLSTGTAKRVSLARALLPLPNLLLLDEPFAGFDFDIREAAIMIISDYLQTGKGSLLLVTHDPYEVARLCEEVSILNGDAAGVTRLSRKGDAEDAFRDRVYQELRRVLIGKCGTVV